MNTAAADLASVERIHVGLGLMPAPLRNAALTANEEPDFVELIEFLGGEVLPLLTSAA